MKIISISLQQPKLLQAVTTFPVPQIKGSEVTNAHRRHVAIIIDVVVCCVIALVYRYPDALSEATSIS
jgi:hypothetical protein